MSKKNTIEAKRQSDGTLVQVLPDGSTKPLEDKTDWKRLRAMTDEEVHAAALADPDAQPLTGADFARMKRVPRIKTLRRALGLTQEEFATRYQIPIGTLRDWEQGRCQPDQPARAYLRVIARDPEGVMRVLEHAPKYVRLAAPQPDVLRVIGEESQRKGTDKLSSRQIDRVIKATRAPKPKHG